MPPNVGLFGPLDDETKGLALAIADAALNPMLHGSGTNLKMLEYAASGTPIITSRTGVRGLGFKDSEVFLAEPDQLPEVLERLKNTPAVALQDMALSARRRVEDHFDWRRIALEMVAAL